MSLEELLPDPWFPFTGDVRVKPLEPPVEAEPPRHGETVETCRTCARPDSDFLWYDDLWRLSAYRNTPIPGIVLLHTRAHVDSFADFAPAQLADLGRVTAKVERAVLEAVQPARVHVSRWGDGGYHFHLWFMPRPAGALQLRGSMLPMWLDLLPFLPSAEVDQALGRVADALRRDGE